MAKITSSYLGSAIVIAGMLGVIGLFALGFVAGLLGYQVSVSNVVAYAICGAIMLPVVLILVYLRWREPATPVAPPAGPGR